ncbi:hypothetical protein SAMN05444156_3032 [Verrucomicrobium sp. GAS474]|nr:hypothetical protein SAMN05444156_3032 [Verrucomicrobium sp. GAS474]
MKWAFLALGVVGYILYRKLDQQLQLQRQFVRDRSRLPLP